MMLRKSKIALAVMCLTAIANFSKAQQGTLEMTSSGYSNSLLGPIATPITVTLRQDSLNANFNTLFKVYNPPVTVTYSLVNQVYHDVYNNISTGLAFGAGRTNANVGTLQMATPIPVYNAFGANIDVEPPLNGMFVSSSTGSVVANYQAGGRGVGLDVEATQNGHDISLPGSPFDYNFGVGIFANVEPLWDRNLDKAGRYYYGDLVLTFSRPVINPVIHIGPLGGSFSYIIGGNQPKISYFTTELELQNAGVTSTMMAGNEYFNVVGNNILNSAAKPNAGSYEDGSATNTFPDYGAATGSVRVNGTITTLTYKVYVRGSANSDFNFSKNLVDLSGQTPPATHDPLNGDLFYVGVSLNKPTQQIFGNVFNDKDQLLDHYIDSSLTLGSHLANAGTNAGGLLYANLLNSSGLVVASTPITAAGTYFFDNVPIGTYSVQLTKNQGAGTYASPQAAPATALPPTWINTGERNGRGLDGDGVIDGRSAQFTLVQNIAQTEINFGIRIQDPTPDPCAQGANQNQLHWDQSFLDATDIGSFEAGANNFNYLITGALASNINSKFIAHTTLNAAQYDFTHSPNLVDNTLDPFMPVYPSTVASNMMLVKSPAVGAVVWSLDDSTVKRHNFTNNTDSQYYFKSGSIAFFSGYFSRVNSDNPQVRVRLYDANTGITLKNVDGSNADTIITLIKASGSWHGFQFQPKLDSVPWQKLRSTVKYIRWEISSVNGKSFAIDLLQICGGATVLPIKMSSFTATKQTSTVLLNWKTSTESNSKNFEVQFSKDGSQWQTIGIVAAAGFSSTERSYNFVHINPVTGANYYRIKMVDMDANFDLSQTRIVTFDKVGGIVVLPNPVVDRVYITSNAVVGLQSVLVFNAEGQLLQQNDNFVAGSSIDMRNLPAGTYLLKITDKQGQTETVRVVKARN